jgi:Fe-Mn family superoxide dismutase
MMDPINLKEDTMAFELPDLPYAGDALAPFISAETLAFHHGKHHRAYVDNLNRLVAGTPWEGSSLEEIIETAEGGIFNNAAQVWNHSFYWSCMSPHGGGEPPAPLSARINGVFGDFVTFRGKFSETALTHFGSGWAWLVCEPSGDLAIVSTGNADNPLRDNLRPLLTCDVWEHAYYIDYRNARAQYIEHFWDVVNWDFVGSNL